MRHTFLTGDFKVFFHVCSVLSEEVFYLFIYFTTTYPRFPPSETDSRFLNFKLTLVDKLFKSSPIAHEEISVLFFLGGKSFNFLSFRDLFIRFLEEKKMGQKITTENSK